MMSLSCGSMQSARTVILICHQYKFMASYNNKYNKLLTLDFLLTKGLLFVTKHGCKELVV